MIKNLYFLLIEIFKSFYYFVKIIFNYKSNVNKNRVCIIHPQAFQFGGGEKVLWVIIKSLLLNKDNHVILFSEKPNNLKEFQIKLKSFFELDLDFNNINLKIISVPKILTNDTKYEFPFINRIFHIIKSLILSLYCLNKDFDFYKIIDTYNGQFNQIFTKLFGKKTIIYTHYPFIHNSLYQKSKNFQKFYYYLNNIFYNFSSKFIDINFCNSSWTLKKMNNNWKNYKNNILLYPPCKILNKECNLNNKEAIIISFAQYRPEKNQLLQLEIIEEVMKEEPNLKFKFIMFGSTKSEDDLKLFNNLKLIVKNKKYENIEIWKNLTFNEIKNIFGKSIIGLHTMKNEHFGISLVEMIVI